MEKSTNNRFTSGFSSIPGMAVLAGLILVAAFFRLTSAIAFLSALLLLSAVSFFWGRMSLQKMKISSRGGEAAAFPGEEMHCSRALTNSKLLPLVSLLVKIPAEEDCCIGPVTPPQEDLDLEDGIADGFSWIMGYQTLEWNQKVKAVHRGICTVDHLELVSGDGFGLSSSRKLVQLEKTFRFVVYPKIIPVNAAPILHSMREMERMRNGIYTDATLISSIRPYREGDSFRTVNWRSLARGSELSVNVYEKLGMHRVCFLIDLPAFTHVVQVRNDRFVEKTTVVNDPKLEHAFSLMASLVLELERRDVLCSFVVPDYGEGIAIVTPDRVNGESALLLKAMAKVRYHAQECAFPLEQLDRERHLLGQIYVFSSPEERSWEKKTEKLGLHCIKVAAEEDTGNEEEKCVVHFLPESELKA